MDKLDLREYSLPDLSAEASLKKAQDDLRNLARKMQTMPTPEGIIAEIQEHKYCNHD